MTLDELFAKMVDKASKAAASADLKASVLLNVTGADPRRWLVSFLAGKVTVAQGGPDAAADLTLTCDGATIIKVATRQTSPMAAFMTGRIKLAGDQALAGQLKNIWPD
jgi:putative sterol carrier protein